jgi:hypothetical protein
VPGLIETLGEPIRNPVTGVEHRARVQTPEGVEFRIAEASSGTTRTTERSRYLTSKTPTPNSPTSSSATKASSIKPQARPTSSSRIE